MASGMKMKVSSILRAAELPVPYVGERKGDRSARSGIRVSASSNGCRVSVTVWRHDNTSDRDTETERKLSDMAFGILIVHGFNASRLDGSTTIRVTKKPDAAAGESLEDAVAAAEASDFDISHVTYNDWLVTVDGRRSRYSIKRSGNGEKVRYAVTSHPRGEMAARLARNLRTMNAAIDTIKQDMQKSFPSERTE